MVDINLLYVPRDNGYSLLLHPLRRPGAQILGNHPAGDHSSMPPENLNKIQPLDWEFSRDWNGEAFHVDASPNRAPVAISSSLPSPIEKPANKESEAQSLGQARPTARPPVGNVWSYIPDCVLSSWRSSQGIPGVRDQAPSPTSHFAHTQKALCSSGYFSDISNHPVAGPKHYECFHGDNGCLQIHQTGFGCILDGMGGDSHHGLLPRPFPSSACLETHRSIPCAHQLASVRL